MTLYGSPPAADAARRPLTLTALRDMHGRGEPVAMLTAYDSSFARAADRAGVDCLLVGDSLGMVAQGHDSTVPVTLEQMAYHVACVARGAQRAWVIGDLPFGSYQRDTAQAIDSSVALMKAGARMVKLEGADWVAEQIHALTRRGIPVCAHLGLTPQSVHALGGYRVQGRDEDGAARLVAQAREVAEAGAAMLVLELMPTAAAQRVVDAVPGVITIGIGAGPVTAGQVLVLHDMLGVTDGRLPRFVRNFMDGTGDVGRAFAAYVAAVKSRTFPDPAVHGY